ncbi:DUF5694 domain-containing protein [Sphingomonas prati]|uniref:Uncharacterized protein n=1 Tax=Sphingomonas prati TaxID=1843237 RepID=A0A7W9BUK6_9SPHN|nr:DUF5694 domain-containing protein [Sphingomonas prati]MBB5730395.1 hypothetical protein [Sphingomonas prati]GGE93754.1 hypothetical protein GCM10011404_28470 [Sphingomonas prati]
MTTLLLMAALAVGAPTAGAAEQRPALMIVGMPHLANPAHDIANEADAKGAFQRCHSIADWVRSYNDTAGTTRPTMPYFALATFGDTARNPGAAWVGAWYARNLRIYANLLHVGGAPGDRTVAVFGAGHGPMLRSNAVESGRFTLVDVLRYLPPAGKPTC